MDVSGCFYLLSATIASRLLEVARWERAIPIEDAWVTGLLAAEAGVAHRDISHLLTRNPTRLTITKAVQNTNTFSRDLLAGPTERRGDRATLAASQAAWGWRHKVRPPFKNIFQSDH